MAKRRAAHRAGTYQAIYDAISAVKTLNFKPKRVRQYAPDPETGKKVYVRTVSEFTPQQKAALSKMAFKREIDSDGNYIYAKTHLYNLAQGVARNEFEFVKITGKDKKKKAKFMRERGFYVTDKGTFNTREGATKSKIVKSMEGYRLEYVYDTGNQPPDRHTKVHARAQRKETFVPFPKEIWGNPDAIAAFIRRVSKQHKVGTVRIAVNGHQGLTAYNPNEMFKYVSSGLEPDLFEPQEYETEEGETRRYRSPFINGFYLVFKERVTEYKKPITWGDSRLRVTKKGRK